MRAVPAHDPRSEPRGDASLGSRWAAELKRHLISSEKLKRPQRDSKGFPLSRDDTPRQGLCGLGLDQAALRDTADDETAPSLGAVASELARAAAEALPADDHAGRMLAAQLIARALRAELMVAYPPKENIMVRRTLLLGHRTLPTPQPYAHLGRDNLRSVMSQLVPVASADPSNAIAFLGATNEPGAEYVACESGVLGRGSDRE
jgi:hypothetical protein